MAAPIVLLNDRFLEWSVGGDAAVLLAYLGWRCLRVVTGRADERDPASGVMEALPAGGGLVAAAAALASSCCRSRAGW